MRRGEVWRVRLPPASGHAQTGDRPALVVWGTADAYIPWKQAERQRESFPSAEIQLLEGLGHWPFMEDPARVAEHVIPFLRGQVGATAGASAPNPSVE